MKQLAWGHEDWAEATPLAAVVAFHATVQSYWLLLYSGLSSGLALYSADSADRILIALAQSRHPTFFVNPAAWLPSFFWVYGTLLRFWPSPDWGPSVLTIVLSNLSLLPLYGICRRIGGEREGSLLATAAAGLMPLSLHVSLQPCFDPLFILIVLCGIYAWLRCEGGARHGWHAAAVAAMSAAALTRYEGWIFVAAWLALTRRRPGLRWRLLALVPISLCLLHQFAAYGGLEFLRLQRDPVLVVAPVLDWRVIRTIWQEVFADGLLLPFVLFAFPALDRSQASVRETLGLVWLPFLAFSGMIQFLGFPLPPEHMAPFLVLQMVPLAPLADRALEACGSSLRAWASAWDRPARLALAMILVLGMTIGWMMRPPPSAMVTVPFGFLRQIGTRLKPGERLLLELPLKGRDWPDGEGFDGPQILRLAVFPAELAFDRPFRYRQDIGTFTLDTATPSVLELPDAELGRRLRRLSVRLIMTRSERKNIERLGWRSAGLRENYHFYTRAGDEFYPMVRAGVKEPQRQPEGRR
ncbi:MAG: hypothetical protein A2506_12550 [Elusimicrobia bacterium RIFOXYD12_FULL_66_9]|nr:MAG: hypothetical protein A2506_12550 [Elusimicrobia bacterium RIFOXYD12_FULL_66_9]